MTSKNFSAKKSARSIPTSALDHEGHIPNERSFEDQPARGSKSNPIDLSDEQESHSMGPQASSSHKKHHQTSISSSDPHSIAKYFPSSHSPTAEIVNNNTAAAGGAQKRGKGKNKSTVEGSAGQDRPKNDSSAAKPLNRMTNSLIQHIEGQDKSSKEEDPVLRGAEIGLMVALEDSKQRVQMIEETLEILRRD
ncbi:uncharacterized protein KY384_002284 [Bacidia gigantensis]|uniref:uncharacterized protein n=1 Tax=Bacidia gigantensis TaxID=2732470 RepID=UPI001D0582A4|nr:uncharacterized protein KY384_002284 [Bacidia gigantensis]KAG8533499.1 hypothetical protein KY384_002284 [Bacidia gigantensis]